MLVEFQRKSSTYAKMIVKAGFTIVVIKHEEYVSKTKCIVNN